MKLNNLSYQIIEFNEQNIEEGYFVKDEELPIISIEFLIDGKTVSDLLKTNNKAIPYYLFENDLPKFSRNEELYLLGVCKCGVDGCGRVTCVVNKEQGFVTFREISNNRVKFPKEFEFRFSRENYDLVITEVLKKINEYRSAIKNELSAKNKSGDK
jgi:hypothetical protein